MNTVQEQVMALIEDARFCAREAATAVVKAMSRAELEADRIASETRRASSELRRRARLATTNAEQLVLFEMARSLPKFIRVERDGDEQLYPWQEATPAQVSAHYDWVWSEHMRELGIIERGRGHWALYEGPADVPIGHQLFAGIVCHICGLPWEPGNLFERAHDTPVGDGTGDQTMHWAHVTCNRAEGTGGTRHEGA